jgi:hypothetical protein
MTRRLKAKDAPVAGPRELLKWRRLIIAMKAAIAAPDETNALVKARNATRSQCAMPRGQFYVGSAFFRLSKMAVTWTSVGLAARRELAAEAERLAETCLAILDAGEDARTRSDIDG